MSWGPPGETKRQSRTVTKEEIQAKLYDATPDFREALEAFIYNIRDGDELFENGEKNHHTGRVWYEGRRKNGFWYFLTITFWMS